MDNINNDNKILLESLCGIHTLSKAQPSTDTGVLYSKVEGKVYNHIGFADFCIAVDSCQYILHFTQEDVSVRQIRDVSSNFDEEIEVLGYLRDEPYISKG